MKIKEERADSSVTFQDHPNILLVITSDSVLANQEELSSVDETASDFWEDLPDSNPGIIPEPTPEFILNLTVDSEPVHDSSETFSALEPTASDSTTSSPAQGTCPALFISLASIEAFIRSMQSEGAQCFFILAHEPIRPITFDIPKFNPDLEGIPIIYLEFADFFLNRKLILFHLIVIVI